jgi:hypothetical protein
MPRGEAHCVCRRGRSASRRSTAFDSPHDPSSYIHSAKPLLSTVVARASEERPGHAGDAATQVERAAGRDGDGPAAEDRVEVVRRRVRPEARRDAADELHLVAGQLVSREPAIVIDSRLVPDGKLLAATKGAVPVSCGKTRSSPGCGGLVALPVAGRLPQLAVGRPRPIVGVRQDDPALQQLEMCGTQPRRRLASLLRSTANSLAMGAWAGGKSGGNRVEPEQERDSQTPSQLPWVAPREGAAGLGRSSQVCTTAWPSIRSEP